MADAYFSLDSGWALSLFAVVTGGLFLSLYYLPPARREVADPAPVPPPDSREIEPTNVGPQVSTMSDPKQIAEWIVGTHRRVGTFSLPSDDALVLARYVQRVQPVIDAAKEWLASRSEWQVSDGLDQHDLAFTRAVEWHRQATEALVAAVRFLDAEETNP